MEGRFDTYGTQGRDFTNDLLGGGPTSKGFAKANLTPRTRTLLEEVALSEQVNPLLSPAVSRPIPMLCKRPWHPQVGGQPAHQAGLSDLS